jgi:hypothetical protein
VSPVEEGREGAAAPGAVPSVGATSPPAFAAGLLLGVMAAALVAIPATLRFPSNAALAWLGLWGAAALVIGPVAGAARIARGSQAVPPAAFSIVLGLLIALGPVALLARVLKVATHHRPLGAVTFALLAATVLAGSLFIATRLLSEVRAQPRGATRYLVLGLAATGLALFLAFLAKGLGAAAGAAGLRGSVLDGVLLLAGVALAAILPLPTGVSRLARAAGPAAWLLAAACAIFVLRRSEIAPDASTHAPLLAALAGL